MKLSDHYFQLYQAYHSEETPLMPVHEQQEAARSFATRIEDMKIHLCCTTRHTKWLIRQLQEQAWIQWEPASGRGKRSRLTFLLHPDEVKARLAMELILEGKYDTALHSLTDTAPRIKEQFHQWLGEQLGHRVEIKGQHERDILRYPFYPCVVSLDPLHALSRHDSHYIEHVMDTLVRYDASTQTLQPHLAHHWESQENGRIWCFYLRKGVTFHHGRELTAEDVVLTFMRLIGASSTARSRELWHSLNMLQVEAVSRYIVRFTLTEPSRILPHYFCFTGTCILPLDVLEANPEAFHRMPVGTGPYKMVRFDAAMMILEANEDYFLGRPELDLVEILTVPELKQQESELLSYKYDFRDKTAGPTSSAAIQDDSTTWRKLTRMEDGASYFTFNMNKPGPQHHALFRQALCRALPVHRIAEELQSENYSPAYSLFHEISAQFQSREGAASITKDAAMFEEWIAQSGYGGETLHIYASQLRPQADYEAEALWLQQHWARLGVQCQVSVIPVHELSKPEVLAQADLVIRGVALGQSPVISAIKVLRNDFGNISNMIGPSARRVVEDTVARIHAGSGESLELLHQLEQKLTNEHLVHYLHHRYHYVYVNTGSSLQNVRLTSNGRVDYKSMWFKR
ncbi:SgrR family transcriptional regulator [Paenibacillus sp. JCM 10914]|uniref:ABC transporter substrate-binding protein n=1 Tax=Paenibacillus sp. JCM 10914 TaxID=1236974 RepID=UPI0003CC6052|nr:ABC transporter substrate-binding protein [Paenibacillus sp. JCM 10914]GAE06359.1 probable ABC transporter protein [Paenibacillus sp. JCM 10914]